MEEKKVFQWDYFVNPQSQDGKYHLEILKKGNSQANGYCAYIHLPESHKLIGRHYEDTNCILKIMGDKFADRWRNNDILIFSHRNIIGFDTLLHPESIINNISVVEVIGLLLSLLGDLININNL